MLTINPLKTGNKLAHVYNIGENQYRVIGTLSGGYITYHYGNGHGIFVEYIINSKYIIGYDVNGKKGIFNLEFNKLVCDEEVKISGTRFIITKNSVTGYTVYGYNIEYFITESKTLYRVSDTLDVVFKNCNVLFDEFIEIRTEGSNRVEICFLSEILCGKKKNAVGFTLNTEGDHQVAICVHQDILYYDDGTDVYLPSHIPKYDYDFDSIPPQHHDFDEEFCEPVRRMKKSRLEIQDERDENMRHLRCNHRMSYHAPDEG